MDIFYATSCKPTISEINTCLHPIVILGFSFDWIKGKRYEVNYTKCVDEKTEWEVNQHKW